MVEENIKKFNDTFHITYDTVKLVRKPADRLVVNAGLYAGQQVLDVAWVQDGPRWRRQKLLEIVEK